MNIESSPLILATLSFLPFALALFSIVELWTLWREHRRRETSLDDINRRIRRERQNATLYWMKAEHYEAEGNYEHALRYYQIAHRICPISYSRSELSVVRRRLEPFVANSIA